MKQPPEWIEKAKETYRFHRSKLLSNSSWRTKDTAKVLRRAVGSVSEDLLIARWLKTHETQIEKFEYIYEALEFIREKKEEQKLRELD